MQGHCCVEWDMLHVKERKGTAAVKKLPSDFAEIKNDFIK